MFSSVAAWNALITSFTSCSTSSLRSPGSRHSLVLAHSNLQCARGGKCSCLAPDPIRSHSFNVLICRLVCAPLLFHIAKNAQVKALSLCNLAHSLHNCLIAQCLPRENPQSRAIDPCACAAAACRAMFRLSPGYQCPLVARRRRASSDDPVRSTRTRHPRWQIARSD